MKTFQKFKIGGNQFSAYCEPEGETETFISSLTNKQADKLRKIGYSVFDICGSNFAFIPNQEIKILKPSKRYNENDKLNKWLNGL